MFQKNCYTCGRPSFSSTCEGAWICPSCGEDLTQNKVYHAQKLERFYKRAPVYGNQTRSGKKI